MLPAENILAEYYRLKSSGVILARAFCDASKVTDYNEIENIFKSGLKANKAYEEMLSKCDDEYFSRVHGETAEIIDKIKERIKGN